MAGIELASAYVSIVPTVKGITGNISKELSAPLNAASAHAGESSAKSFGQKFKGGLGTAIKGIALLGGITAAVEFGKGVVKASSDLNESTNAVTVMFGDAAGAVLAIGENSATSLGLSKSEFNSLAVQFGSFATTIAGKGGDVAGTLGEMSTRAADFASVMNLDVGESARLFQSGLAGETEPLRRYGLDLSAAAVEAYAMANGIGTTGVALTETQKVQARYGLLMASTSKTAGDFANTSDGLANQQRILAASFENSKAGIGKALMPAMAAIMPVVSTLADWLGTNLPKAIDFMRRAFNAITPVLKTIAGGLQTAFRWLMDNKEVVVGAAIAIGAVVVAMFVAWAAAAAPAAAATIAANAPFIAIGVAVAAVAAAVLYAYNHFGWFRAAVDAVVVAFQAAWAFISKYILPVFKAVVEVAIKVVVAYFKLLVAIIRDYVIPMFKGIWSVITNVVLPAFQAVWSVITNIIIPAFQAVWRFIRDKVLPIFAAIGTFIVTAGATVGRVVGSIVGFVTGIPGRIKAVVSGMWDGIKNGITAAKNWVRDRVNDIVGIAAAIPAKISSAVSGMWEGLKSGFKAVLNWIIGKFNWMIGKANMIPFVNIPSIPTLHAGGVVPGRGDVPTVLRGGELVLTGAQQAQLFSIANGATVGDRQQPPVVVNNYRRDIGIGDLQHVLAMARLTA